MSYNKFLSYAPPLLSTMFVLPFFNNTLNSFMMISASATIPSHLRVSSSRRCPRLPGRCLIKLWHGVDC